MNTRKSTSYIFTLDVNSVNDMEKLELVKKTVSSMNKFSSLKRRVVLRGRKPVVKQTVMNRYTGKVSTRSYDFGGNIVGGIKNATSIDVYVYDRKW